MPGHNICFLITARTCAIATKIQAPTRIIVKTVKTHSTAGDDRAPPMVSPAVHRATWGNTKDHHCIVKRVLPAVATLTLARAKNQKLRSQKKMPAGTPTAFQTSPTGIRVMPRKSSGRTLPAWVPRDTKVYEVYAENVRILGLVLSHRGVCVMVHKKPHNGSGQ